MVKNSNSIGQKQNTNSQKQNNLSLVSSFMSIPIRVKVIPIYRAKYVSLTGFSGFGDLKTCQLTRNVILTEFVIVKKHIGTFFGERADLSA